MGHTTAFVLTGSHLLGVVATTVGIVALYFRDALVGAVRGRRS